MKIKDKLTQTANHVLAQESTKKLVLVSLAFWILHIVFRVLLLFRVNPYGFPFVSKPDWYIFHAVCIDFLWIVNTLVIFVLAATALKKGARAITAIYTVLHGILLFYTYFDHEIQRFLGTHLTFGIIGTYKDVSSIRMFWDYAANDNSVPFLQFFIFALMFPAVFFTYKLLSKIIHSKKALKCSLIAVAVFYAMSYLYVNVIWTGNARMTKLRPVVSLIYNDLFSSGQSSAISEKDIANYATYYQAIWNNVECDSLWKFTDSQKPLYREPSETLRNDSTLKQRRQEQANFIIVFMESQRGLNTGFLNPDIPSPTPYFDSLATHSHVWERMHTSGLPTTGGVLTSHMGLPHHSSLAQATDLAHLEFDSYASVLKDSGYTTHYFSAADPAWDNLGVWMSKWYNGIHYDRNREDDSTFFDHAISYVIDTLAKQEKPFLATFTTRSNHYPFNFAAGMTDEQKSAPLTERINYTMAYADRQLARFMRAVEKEPWYSNTYVIILADHGFPLGENGVSTMVGGGFSNATWIPFLIHGKNIEPSRDTTTTAQIDIAPTILELAGIVTPNIFMGHNIMRGYGRGLSMGVYTKVSALGYENHRIIAQEQGDSWLYLESDTHQNNDLSNKQPNIKEKLKRMLDSLITLSDYTLEHGK